MTGTAIRTDGAPWTVSKTDSSNPGSPAETWISVLPAIRSTVLLNAKRTLWFAVCMPTNTATPRTIPAIVRSVRTTCLRKYGQLINRSRIMRSA